MSDATQEERLTISQGKGTQLEGSREALRRVTIMLEVLSGLRGPTEGAKALDINLTHYYSLESKALQGMISALERRPPGRPRKRAEEQIAELETELATLKTELARAHALVRQSQRALGLREATATKPPAAKKKRSKRRGKPRATKVAERLRTRLEPESDGEPPSTPPS